MDVSRAGRHHRLLTAAAAVGVGAALLATPAHAGHVGAAAAAHGLPGSVEPVDLQVPGQGAAARRISESGVVVGVSYADDGRMLAFRWQDGEAAVLGDVDADSSAQDVNEPGQVLVQTYLADGSTGALLWQPDGSAVDLAPDVDEVAAGDLDDQGRVALELTDPASGLPHAAVWQDGTLTLLDDQGGHSSIGSVRALNERGDVVGTVTDGDGSRAVVWRDGAVTRLPVPTGATGSYGEAVNERGDVLGVVVDDGRTRAVLWEEGRLRYLAPVDAPRQTFYDLNERGTAVGTLGDRQVGLGAALADRSGVKILPTLGGPSGTAYAVNGRGTVVGTTTTDAGAAYGHATAWVRGRALPLDGWVDDEEPVHSVALDVDEQGRAVGYVQRRGPDGGLLHNMRALLWEVSAGS
ncbi:hypothetical protein [Cellulomonas phragmiteti]|uniref:Uncharacterized protein n=1 Tax=Cellulomonas phragmiteti TaxID=478780 RepID=A0ABQ4DHD9_9CELL|nr:hypothetical protein [Cellulomonas phragmiteti]GIG38760.1 hypothetical protein Cph01nite_05220 [Cellulomonas phragmiteti]